MKSQQSSTVPKFSSFKPKNIAEPLQGDEQKPSELDDGHARREEGSETRREHRRPRRDREPRKQLDVHYPALNKEDANTQTAKTSGKLLAKDLESDDSFFRIDRRGDPANLAFRGLERSKVPRYYRVGQGRVLGTHPAYRIDQTASNDRQVVLEVPGHVHLDNVSPLRTSHRTLQRSVTRSNRFVRSRKDGENLGTDEEPFIPLNYARKRKRNSDVIVSGEEVDYRSIEKPNDENRKTDISGWESSSESDGSEIDEHTDMGAQQAKQTNAELTRRTKETPGDLQAWLDLIEHQLVMIRLDGNSLGPRLSLIEERSLAEIRLSIYNDALSKFSKHDSARSQLWLGLLEQGSKLWDEQTLAKKWEEAFNETSNDVEVWIRHLSFLQTRSKFRFEDCKDAYLKCLGLLASAERTEIRIDHRERIAFLRLTVFLRLTTFMRESGYHEHAEALWQAILELHFFRPPRLVADNTEISELLRAFEEFWDSEVPRIGEEGDQGWAQFDPDMEQPEPAVMDASVPNDHNPPFRQFAVMETRTAQNLRHVGRTLDETGLEDVHHTVLFADVDTVVQAMAPKVPLKLLIQAFLCYSGLPPFSSDDDSASSLWLDMFLRMESLKPGSAQKRFENETRLISTLSALNSNPMKNIRTGTESLFTFAFTTVQLGDPQWTVRVLKRLTEALSHDDDIAEYFLALDHHVNGAMAAKSAKQLLKRRPHSLRLYNAYALIEARNGHTESSNRAFSIAFASSAPNDPSAALLLRTWVWEALRVGQFGVAAYRILAIGEPNTSLEYTGNNSIPTFSPVAVLKARTKLIERLNDMLAINKLRSAVLYGELIALLSYLVQDKSLESALDSFQETFALLKQRGLNSSGPHEELHQARTQFLFFHVEHTRIYKPSVIREQLLDSVTVFPNNTMFLSAFAAIEAQFRLDDRLRTSAAGSLDTHLSPEKSIVALNFEIWREMQRGLEFGGTVHAVRAAFEQAVDSKNGKHSIALWASYLRFECHVGDKKRARDVFWRGSGQVPWAKWFIMKAFEWLDDVMNFDELNGVYEMLVQRELRVHVDINEMLRQRGIR